MCAKGQLELKEEEEEDLRRTARKMRVCCINMQARKRCRRESRPRTRSQSGLYLPLAELACLFIITGFNSTLKILNPSLMFLLLAHFFPVEQRENVSFFTGNCLKSRRRLHLIGRDGALSSRKQSGMNIRCIYKHIQ